MSAIGWHVTWTSETGSGAEGPFTDLDWAVQRLLIHARQMRVVTIAPHIEASILPAELDYTDQRNLG